MVIAPFERDESTKTGYFDETVVLDDDVLPELGALLFEQAKARAVAQGVTPASVAGQKTPVWGFTAAAFLDAWRDCVVCLGLQEFLISPYQARHGGASRDYIMRKRIEEDIRARGHWSTVSAARIYRKPGRIQQLVAHLKPAELRLAMDIQKDFAKLFRDGSFRPATNAVA